LRALAVVILSISLPLTVASVGIDEKVIAIGGGAVTLVSFLLLALSFEWFRARIQKATAVFRGGFRQSLTASSLTLIFGTATALTWSSGLFPRALFCTIAILSVNWWFHVLAKTDWLNLQSENRGLKQARDRLEKQVDTLVPAGEENDRLRAVVQHVINVLASLERAREGRMGVQEVGAAAWIEHRCLRSTRDVLASATGRRDYKIELGIIRVPDEVAFIDMAAGELLKQYQEQGGCPLERVPDREAIEGILRRKEIEGGFADSRAVEFKLHGEPHYMVALSSAEFDEIDAEMLALIGAMFVVLKQALEA
jgi:hypothetical protein